VLAANPATASRSITSLICLCPHDSPATSDLLLQAARRGTDASGSGGKRQKALLLAVESGFKARRASAEAARKRKSGNEALKHYRRELELVGRNSEIEKNEGRSFDESGPYR